MAREIFYTAVRYNEDGSTQHASGVVRQLDWQRLKGELAEQGFHIKSWFPIEPLPSKVA